MARPPFDFWSILKNPMVLMVVFSLGAMLIFRVFGMMLCTVNAAAYYVVHQRVLTSKNYGARSRGASTPNG
jgi:hypothetical protein